MKDEHNLRRSRNARLNLARRQAEQLYRLLNPKGRPKDDNADGWNEIFAEARDMAEYVHQGVHEASAYHNALKDGPADIAACDDERQHPEAP